MLQLAKVIITHKDGISKVLVDGKDLSKQVTKIEFCHEGGHTPELKLTIPTDEVEIQYVGSLMVEKRKLK